MMEMLKHHCILQFIIFTTPVITNLTTMQSIKVEREVPAGWRLEIDTTYGHNTVELIKVMERE